MPLFPPPPYNRYRKELASEGMVGGFSLAAAEEGSCQPTLWYPIMLKVPVTFDPVGLVGTSGNALHPGSCGKHKYRQAWGGTLATTNKINQTHKIHQAIRFYIADSQAKITSGTGHNKYSLTCYHPPYRIW